MKKLNVLLVSTLVFVFLSTGANAMLNLEESASVGVDGEAPKMQNRMQVMTTGMEKMETRMESFEGRKEAFRQKLEEQKMNMDKRREMIKEKRKEILVKIAERVTNRVKIQAEKLKKVKDRVGEFQERLELRISKITDEGLRAAAQEKKDALLITKDEVANIIAELSSQRERFVALKEDENWEELQTALEAYKAELKKFKQALHMGIGQAKNMREAIIQN